MVSDSKMDSAKCDLDRLAQKFVRSAQKSLKIFQLRLRILRRFCNILKLYNHASHKDGKEMPISGFCAIALLVVKILGHVLLFTKT